MNTQTCPECGGPLANLPVFMGRHHNLADCVLWLKSQIEQRPGPGPSGIPALALPHLEHWLEQLLQSDDATREAVFAMAEGMVESAVIKQLARSDALRGLSAFDAARVGLQVGIAIGRAYQFVQQGGRLR